MKFSILRAVIQMKEFLSYANYCFAKAANNRSILGIKRRVNKRVEIVKNDGFRRTKVAYIPLAAYAVSYLEESKRGLDN